MSNLVFIKDKIINKDKIIDIKFYEKVFYENKEHICIKFLITDWRCDVFFYKKGFEETAKYIQECFYCENNYQYTNNYININTNFDEKILKDVVSIRREFNLFINTNKSFNKFSLIPPFEVLEQITDFFEEKGFKKTILYGAEIYLDPIASIETNYSYSKENGTDITRSTITKYSFFGKREKKIDTWTGCSKHILNNKKSNYNYLLIELEPIYSSKEEILNYFK